MPRQPQHGWLMEAVVTLPPSIVKIQTIPKKKMSGRKFIAWGPLKFLDHLDIWVGLDKKDKSGQNSVWTVNFFTDPDFVLFAESCSNVQMS